MSALPRFLRACVRVERPLRRGAGFVRRARRLVCLIGWCLTLAAGAGTVAYAEAPKPIEPALTLARFGEVHPAGWILREMRADLDSGLAGHFADISDTVNQNRFANRSGSSTDGEPYWWSGEHEGYYADGLFRLAWLAGDDAVKQAAIRRLEEVLDAQDADGYIGIYPPAQRFSTTAADDAELWTQSRIFQALLAWYEATGERRILAAVERAVRLTLAEYRGKSYFGRPGIVTGGGVSHGVGFADTLEWLYRLTRQDVYRRGYLWLYGDYAAGKARDSDLTPANLIDANKVWTSHTPHIAESLAMPAIAFAYGGPAQYEQAADNVLGKLRRFSNPGGGPVGDESVRGRDGAFDLTSEYCSMTETIASLNRLAQYRDVMQTADIAERIALNDAQGARLHPAATGVSYLTADNRLEAEQTSVYGDRLLFSAAHQVAPCCALNSTRMLPYYVEGMWLKQTTRPGLVARLYGPSTLETTLKDASVEVVEETDFPFSDKLRFIVYSDEPVKFTLTLRIPAYAHEASVVAPHDKKVVRLVDRFEVSGRWVPGDSVALDLAFRVYRMQDSEGEQALAYGPLLFALPVDAIATPGRVTQAHGAATGILFRDTSFVAKTRPLSYRLAADARFAPQALTDGDALDPWTRPPLGLSGMLVAPDGAAVKVMLRPLGSTLLRETGFPTQ